MGIIFSIFQAGKPRLREVLPQVTGLLSRSTVAVLSVVSRKLCRNVAGNNSKPRKLNR